MHKSQVFYSGLYKSIYICPFQIPNSNLSHFSFWSIQGRKFLAYFLQDCCYRLHQDQRTLEMGLLVFVRKHWVTSILRGLRKDASSSFSDRSKQQAYCFRLGTWKGLWMNGFYMNSLCSNCGEVCSNLSGIRVKKVFILFKFSTNFQVLYPIREEKEKKCWSCLGFRTCLFGLFMTNVTLTGCKS